MNRKEKWNEKMGLARELLDSVQPKVSNGTGGRTEYSFNIYGEDAIKSLPLMEYRVSLKGSLRERFLKEFVYE